jgi:Ca2+-binding RTX toxin-like protein
MTNRTPAVVALASMGVLGSPAFAQSTTPSNAMASLDEATWSKAGSYEWKRPDNVRFIIVRACGGGGGGAGGYSIFSRAVPGPEGETAAGGGGGAGSTVSTILLGPLAAPSYTVVIGNGGNDWVKTDDGADNITTAAGRDLIFSGGGDDLVEALEGNDFIDAGGGNDEAGGGAGADMVFGGHGDDELNAGEGNDYVDGGAGADELSGGSDNDIIYDGSGSDRIEGRRGNDKIFLSADSDADIIGFRPGEAGVDTIFGFDIPPEKEADQYGGDQIDLQRFKLDEDKILDAEQVLREGTRFGTQVSVDPTGGDDADAVKLAVLIGIRPEDLGVDSIDSDIFLL